MKHNTEKFHQASVTINKVTNRKENSSDMINKDIQVAKEDINRLSAANAKMNYRRSKLLRRVTDEHQLIDTLNNVVVRLKKEITDTNVSSFKIDNIHSESKTHLG